MMEYWNIGWYKEIVYFIPMLVPPDEPNFQ